MNRILRGNRRKAGCYSDMVGGLFYLFVFVRVCVHMLEGQISHEVSDRLLLA